MKNMKKEVVLDTSFILTCVKQKIDFFEEIKLMGIQILIPEQVIRELKNLDINHSKLALKILGKHKFKKIDLKIKNVDNGIKEFAKMHKDTIVATLDRELKRIIKSPKLIIIGGKKLEVV